MMMTQVLFRNIVNESEAELEELGDMYPLNAKYIALPNNLSDAKDFVRLGSKAVNVRGQQVCRTM